MPARRTAPARWQPEQLCEILNRRQANAVRTMLTRWYAHVWSPGAESVRKTTLRIYPRPEGAIA